MPETRNKPGTAGATGPPEAGALFQLLLGGKREAGQVYTAMRELQSMAGENVVAQLTGLIRATAAEQSAAFQKALAEQGAAFQKALAEQGGRLDSVERQLGRIGTLLFLLLGTLVGTLTTLLTTLLLRG